MDRPPDFPPVPIPVPPTVSVTLDPSPPPSLTTSQHGDWPTPSVESVKLFVGQVPKHFDEKQLRQHIESYAPIEGLTILRDRVSGMHKGQLY